MMKYCSQCGGKTKLEIPQDDDRPRFICSQCGFVHYQNPRLVVGSIPVHEDQVLLCLRAIEPRKNYWTLPAGFLESGESISDGAIRETEEEALIRPNLGEIIAIVDVVYAEQVHVFFRAGLDNLDFGPGRESLDVKLFKLTDIPWEEIAFKTVEIALKAQINKASSDHIPIYETIT